MSEFFIILAGIPAGIWLYLLVFRGRFWLERPAQDVAPAAGNRRLRVCGIF